MRVFSRCYKYFKCGEREREETTKLNESNTRRLRVRVRVRVGGRANASTRVQGPSISYHIITSYRNSIAPSSDPNTSKAVLIFIFRRLYLFQRTYYIQEKPPIHRSHPRLHPHQATTSPFPCPCPCHNPHLLNNPPAPFFFSLCLRACTSPSVAYPLPLTPAPGPAPGLVLYVLFRLLVVI